MRYLSRLLNPGFLSVPFFLLMFADGLAGAEEVPILRTVTYNLRYASNQAPNAWPDRRSLLTENVRNLRPDVMGTQEGLFHQIKEVEADLPEMRWIGLGREGGSRGEFMAVFYRPERLEPLEFDHFWLSDTPDTIGSATWGNTSRRMVTWVRFRDREADREFYFVNTHFDNAIAKAREQSAAFLRERIEDFRADLPIILVGDFNAVAGADPTYEILTGDGFFRDSWETARRLGDEHVNTFNRFEPLVRGGQRIDWILHRGPVRAVETKIVTFDRNGQYPSDHFPVVTTFSWK